MVFFFYGEDSYRIRQKISSVIAGYQAKHKSGLNFGRFDFSREGEWDKFKNFIDSFSMFAEKKLAVLDGVLNTKKSEAQNKFLEFLEASDIAKDQERFVVIGQELRRAEEKKGGGYVLGEAKELFKKLTAKNVSFQEFENLSGAKLEAWIRKEIESRGGKFEAQAVRALADYVGSDLYRMSNEIDKLISFKAGQTVLAADVEIQVKAKLENDIFKTVDALAARRGSQAIKLLHQHLEEGESEIYLLSMLVYQFRNLLLVKSQAEKGLSFDVLAKKLKMHPFVLRKSFDQSRNFTYKFLSQIYERLFEIDVAIKSGRLEPGLALDLAVKEIVG